MRMGKKAIHDLFGRYFVEYSNGTKVYILFVCLFVPCEQYSRTISSENSSLEVKISSCEWTGQKKNRINKQKNKKEGKRRESKIEKKYTIWISHTRESIREYRRNLELCSLWSINDCRDRQSTLSFVGDGLDSRPAPAGENFRQSRSENMFASGAWIILFKHQQQIDGIPTSRNFCCQSVAWKMGRDFTLSSFSFFLSNLEQKSSWEDRQTPHTRAPLLSEFKDEKCRRTIMYKNHDRKFSFSLSTPAFNAATNLVCISKIFCMFWFDFECAINHYTC